MYTESGTEKSSPLSLIEQSSYPPLVGARLAADAMLEKRLQPDYWDSSSLWTLEELILAEKLGTATKEMLPGLITLYAKNEAESYNRSRENLLKRPPEKVRAQLLTDLEQYAYAWDKMHQQFEATPTAALDFFESIKVALLGAEAEVRNYLEEVDKNLVEVFGQYRETSPLLPTSNRVFCLPKSYYREIIAEASGSRDVAAGTGGFTLNPTNSSEPRIALLPLNLNFELTPEHPEAGVKPVVTNLAKVKRSARHEAIHLVTDRERNYRQLADGTGAERLCGFKSYVFSQTGDLVLAGPDDIGRYMRALDEGAVTLLEYYLDAQDRRDLVGLDNALRNGMFTHDANTSYLAGAIIILQAILANPDENLEEFLSGYIRSQAYAYPRVLDNYQVELTPPFIDTSRLAASSGNYQDSALNMLTIVQEQMIPSEE